MIPTKYYIYGGIFLFIVSVGYFGVSSYNDAIEEASLQAIRAEAAEAANMALTSEKETLSKTLEKRQLDINVLNEKRNTADENLRKVFKKLREERNKCIDAKLPDSIISGLQQDSPQAGGHR